MFYTRRDIFSKAHAIRSLISIFLNKLSHFPLEALPATPMNIFLSININSYVFNSDNMLRQKSSIKIFVIKIAKRPVPITVPEQPETLLIKAQTAAIKRTYN